MKTAVSIPDNVYTHAENLARQLGTSRSKLYTQALRNYLAAHQSQAVTQKLDEVYGDASNSLDDGLVRLQTSSLPREDW
jgi:metal-responsive CopG/Arc/MetJ family transcriptional regulator